MRKRAAANRRRYGARAVWDPPAGARPFLRPPNQDASVYALIGGPVARWVDATSSAVMVRNGCHPDSILCARAMSTCRSTRSFERPRRRGSPYSSAGSLLALAADRHQHGHGQKCSRHRTDRYFQKNHDSSSPRERVAPRHIGMMSARFRTGKHKHRSTTEALHVVGIGEPKQIHEANAKTAP